MRGVARSAELVEEHQTRVPVVDGVVEPGEAVGRRRAGGDGPHLERLARLHREGLRQRVRVRHRERAGRRVVHDGVLGLRVDRRQLAALAVVVVAAQRVEADAGVVELLGEDRPRVLAGDRAVVTQVADLDHELDALVDELLVELPGDVDRAGVRVLAVVSDGPLRVGLDAERPRLGGGLAGAGGRVRVSAGAPGGRSRLPRRRPPTSRATRSDRRRRPARRRSPTPILPTSCSRFPPWWFALKDAFLPSRASPAPSPPPSRARPMPATKTKIAGLGEQTMRAARGPRYSEACRPDARLNGQKAMCLDATRGVLAAGCRRSCPRELSGSGDSPFATAGTR